MSPCIYMDLLGHGSAGAWESCLHLYYQKIYTFYSYSYFDKFIVVHHYEFIPIGYN